MKLKTRSARALTDRVERAIARLAMIAANDAWHGGARALVLLKRLEGSPNYQEYREAVNASYGSSNPPTSDYVVCECPECGQVYLGESKAYDCCADTQAWLEDAYEEDEEEMEEA